MSSMDLCAFLGSLATDCQISPCLGSLRAHFARRSCCFSCARGGGGVSCYCFGEGGGWLCVLTGRGGGRRGGGVVMLM